MSRDELPSVEWSADRIGDAVEGLEHLARERADQADFREVYRAAVAIYLSSRPGLPRGEALDGAVLDAHLLYQRVRGSLARAQQAQP